MQNNKALNTKDFDEEFVQLAEHPLSESLKIKPARTRPSSNDAEYYKWKYYPSKSQPQFCKGVVPQRDRFYAIRAESP